MTIELLTKDEIINIKEFPNDIKNRFMYKFWFRRDKRFKII